MTTVTSTLNDMVVAVHFHSGITLSVLDAADWIATFQKEFPIIQEVAAAPPTDLTNVVGAPQLVFSQASELPRIVMRSSVSQKYVLLQQDRFAVGWSRARPLGEPDDYPGYEHMKVEWTKLAAQHYEWAQRRYGEGQRSKLIELTYTNAIPSLDESGKPVRRLSDVFSIISPSYDRKYNAFSSTWVEAQNFSDPETPRVSAQIGIGKMPTGQTVFFFNFVGLGPLVNHAVHADSLAALDALHSRILDMRRAAINLT